MFFKLCPILILIVLCPSAYSQDEHGVSTDVDTLRFLYFPTADHPVEIKYDDTSSIAASGLVPLLPTTIIIDGFLSTYPSNMSITLLQSLFEESGANSKNVIVLDWGTMSGAHSPLLTNLTTAFPILVPLVIPNLPLVGVRVAEFLEFLRIQKQIDRKNVHIIGHSMGAHISGYAGKSSNANYTLIGRITGLDPANADTFPTSMVLYKTDADLVDAYYTNRGGMGTARTDAADMDVYINGGNDQPDCDGEELVPGYCSHSFSWQFYASTILNSRWGCPCSTTLPSSGASCFCKINCNASCGAGSTRLGHDLLRTATHSEYYITVKDLNRNSTNGADCLPKVLASTVSLIIISVLAPSIALEV